MQAIRDNFVYQYKKTAEAWEGQTDGRAVFVGLYNLVLSGLDEMIEKDIQSVYAKVAFMNHLEEDKQKMDQLLKFWERTEGK